MRSGAVDHVDLPLETNFGIGMHVEGIKQNAIGGVDSCLTSLIAARRAMRLGELRYVLFSYIPLPARSDSLG